MDETRSLSKREHEDLRQVIDSGVDRLDARRRQRNVAVSSIVAVVLVAAITTSALAAGAFRGSQVPIATGSPSPSSTATETAPTAPPPTSSTLEPSASPTAPADVDQPVSSSPSEWIVSQDGIGPFRLGMRIGDAVADLPDAVRCRDDGGFPPYLALNGTLWIGESAIQSGDDFTSTGEVSLIAYVGQSASAEGPSTAEGISAGSTRSEVLAAYPDAAELYRNGPVLQIGRIYFALDPDGTTVQSVGVTSGDVPYEFCG